jgi:hypothetical protein
MLFDGQLKLFASVLQPDPAAVALFFGVLRSTLAVGWQGVDDGEGEDALARVTERASQEQEEERGHERGHEQQQGEQEDSLLTLELAPLPQSQDQSGAGGRPSPRLARKVSRVLVATQLRPHCGSNVGTQGATSYYHVRSTFLWT